MAEDREYIKSHIEEVRQEIEEAKKTLREAEEEQETFLQKRKTRSHDEDAPPKPKRD